jgi:hypothetical protein
MMEAGDITDHMATLRFITKKDMMPIMVGTISIINGMAIDTGITKSGTDIIIAGIKSTSGAGIITTRDVTIGRSIGSIIIITITTIIIGPMKGPLSDSN